MKNTIIISYGDEQLIVDVNTGEIVGHLFVQHKAVIQLTRLGWALLGFMFWLAGMFFDNTMSFFIFGWCFGKSMFGKFDNK